VPNSKGEEWERGRKGRGARKEERGKGKDDLHPTLLGPEMKQQ